MTRRYRRPSHEAQGTEPPAVHRGVSISSIGLGGIAQAEASASRSASSLVQAAVGRAGGTDVAQDVVSLTQAGAGVAIGAKVVETGEQLTKALLDIFA